LSYFYRALIHHPAYASKNNRFSSLPEESAIEILIGIANGMDHLAKHKVLSTESRRFNDNYSLILLSSFRSPTKSSAPGMSSW